MTPEEEHYYYTEEGRNENDGCGTMSLIVGVVLVLFVLICLLR